MRKERKKESESLVSIKVNFGYLLGFCINNRLKLY